MSIRNGKSRAIIPKGFIPGSASCLVEHAERELRALPGRRTNDRIMLERDVVALVGLFEAQRHSGASARFVADALNKLLRWEKLA